MPTSVLKLDGCTGSFEVSERAYASSIPMVGWEQRIHQTALANGERVAAFGVLFPQATGDLHFCGTVVLVPPLHRNTSSSFRFATRE